MLLFLELNGTNSIWLHVGGTALVASRILHGLGLSQNAGTSAGRFVGILINYLVLIIGAGALIKGYFTS